MKKIIKMIKKLILIIITTNIVFFSLIQNTNISYGATGQDIAEYASQWAGKTPYVSGGTSLTGGTDCSGFVMLIYAHFQYSVPNYTVALKTTGEHVDYADIQPGDIIIIKSDVSKTGYHVGLYYGEGKWVHCSSPKNGTLFVNFSPDDVELVDIRRVIGAVPGGTGEGAVDGGTKFRPQGEVDEQYTRDNPLDLDSKIFEFAGNPSKMEYNGEIKPIQWIFSKFSQFIDLILGLMLSGTNSAIVGWFILIENIVNSALYTLSFG